MAQGTVIAVDCDDLLLDWMGPFLAWHNRTYGTSITKEDVKEYRLYDLLGITRKELDVRVRRYATEPEYARLPIMPGAKEFVSALMEEHDVVIVTARDLEVSRITRKNLENRFGFKFGEILHVNSRNGRGHFESKAIACEKVGACMLIDDHHENIALCIQHNANMRGVLYHQPWNVNIKMDGVPRARTHEEIVVHIREMLPRIS